MNAGFYKIQDDQMLYAPNIVEGNGYMLVAQEKDSYNYPVDGWYWFDDGAEASLVQVDDQAQAAHDAAAVAFEAMTPGKQALWEPVRAAVSKALKAGEFERAYTILVTVPPLYDGMEDDRAAFLALFQ